MVWLDGKERWSLRSVAQYFLRRRPSRATFASSGDYWRQRYRSGGDSGGGSYNHLAEFKAEVLNELVRNQQIVDVIEFGCGDGSQLTLANYPSYVGYDISPEAVTMCRAKFAGDESKTFYLLGDYDGRMADAAISLDVIFHLVEDHVFESYMRRLFRAGRRFVVVYSSDEEAAVNPAAPHVRHRAFTSWIRAEEPEWELSVRIPNRYPYNGDWQNTSFADFFVFSRRER